MSFLSQSESQRLDERLMSDECGFTLSQLMELAGLSVAEGVHKLYPMTSYPRILVLCGPGNNGGDGLVAARHLASFGYNVSVFMPRIKSTLQVRNNIVKLINPNVALGSVLFNSVKCLKLTS